MAIELHKNMVYEWANSSAPNSVERLLWLDPTSVFVWTISIYNRKAQPVRRTRCELQEALESGQARVLPRDPYQQLIRPESDIKKKHRERRDKAWKMIAPLLDRLDERIFHFYQRSSPITALIARQRYSKATVYRLLRQYFQRGQTKNALLPLYDNCGWRNRLENSSRHDEKPNTTASKKLGRPSKLAAASGEPRGINITKEILQIILTGIRLFYEVREKPSLIRAFHLTLQKFFNCGYHQDKNGNWIPELPPANELPTYHQFKYWYKKLRQPRQSQIARYGLIRHNLSGRAKLGDSTQMAFGPGSLFQVDATIGDGYLLSSLDRNLIIGRSVIYFIIDVFSRLIAGLSIALEGPSWLGAMLALENAARDKVAFCAEYGISIEQAEWPACHLPEGLIADRGELEGFNADHLVNALNIRVHNTPPYRADLKGIVEQHINVSNQKTIHWIPGRVRKRERGEPDYRLDATLTLREFTKLMIYSVLDHNNQQRLDLYRKDEYMIADHVEPYPIDLWNWGVQNRTGHLRQLDIDTVRLNLLPQAEASVTQTGIYFQNLKYTCELADKEQWLERAGEKGSWKIPIAHDPRTTSRIYLRLDNGKRMETCHLLAADKTFLDRDWYETLEEFELRAQRKEAAQTRKFRARAQLHAATSQIISAAEEKNRETRVPMSARARVSGIRENRKQERHMERQKTAWHLGSDPAPTQIETELINSGGYVPPPQPTDKLRKARERISKK